MDIFYLKKLVSQFLMPVPLISILLFVGFFRLWFTRKQFSGKLIASTGFLFFLLLSNAQVSNYFTGYLESQFAPNAIQLSTEEVMHEEFNPVKFIVVLGAGIRPNRNVPVTAQVTELSLVRLIEGIRIYRKSPGSKLVISGGSKFSSVSNAELGADIAKDLGVEEMDIILVPDAMDTKDEARHIQPIVGEDKFMLVTSAVHMSRAKAMFEKLGMSPIPAPTGHLFNKNYATGYNILPLSSENLEHSGQAIHEYLGVVWASLRGQI